MMACRKWARVRRPKRTVKMVARGIEGQKGHCMEGSDGPGEVSLEDGENEGRTYSGIAVGYSL